MGMSVTRFGPRLVADVVNLHICGHPCSKIDKILHLAPGRARSCVVEWWSYESEKHERGGKGSDDDVSDDKGDA